MSWTIETKILPLLGGLTGHLYLEIFNPQGERMCQVHGLATCARSGQPKAIGGAGDVLKAYIGTQFLLSGTGSAGRDDHPHRGHVIFKGEAADIKDAVLALQQAAKDINARNVPYILMSQNSNSAFMVMVDALAAALPIDREGVAKTLQMKKILPGVANKSLTQAFNRDASSRTPPRKPGGRQPKP